MTPSFRNIAVLLLAACGTLAGQNPTVFSTGLKNPSRIITGPSGTLLVTEADTAPNSGRISLIDSAGNRRTLIDGLPSGMAAPDMSIDGPNGLALNGRTLFIANGEGDSHRNGPTQGTIVPNPAGPSSPIFSTILQVTFSNDIDKLSTGFSLGAQDHFTLADHNAVTLTNSSGDQAVLQLLTEFRIDRPDPRSIYRNTHLYGLALQPLQPNSLYAADAGNNAIWKVDLTTGRVQLLTRFPATPNPIAPIGPPNSEAVPTSVHAYEDQLLVSLFAGAPFVPGTSRVMQVDPVTGKAGYFVAVLSSAIDTLYRKKADGSQQWFVLQYSMALAATPPAPGRLVVYNTPNAQVVVDKLTTPTSIALDSATGRLYITDRSDGTVLVVNAGL